MINRDKQMISRLALNVSLLVSFMTVGVAEAFLGPALAQLTSRWGVPLTEGGVLYTMLFSGSFMAVALTGKLLGRIGLRLALSVSALLLALGFVGVALAPGMAVAIAVTLLLGLGVGGLAVNLNLLTAALYPRTRSAALNLINVFFGAGALFAPLLVSTSSGTPGGLKTMLIGLGIVALFTSLGFALLPMAGLQTVDSPISSSPPLRTLLNDRYVLILIVTFFLYVGAEAGFGGWAYSFASIGAHLDVAGASLIVTAFWLSFTLGRLAAGLVARFVTARTLVVSGALLAAGGGALVVLFNFNPALLFIGAVLVGVGCAPIFPTSFALATLYRHDWAASVSSLGVLAGSLGGAILPFIQGQLLAYWGVAGGASFTVLVLLAIVGLQFGARRGDIVAAPNVGPVI